MKQYIRLTKEIFNVIVEKLATCSTAAFHSNLRRQLRLSTLTSQQQPMTSTKFVIIRRKAGISKRRYS